MIEIYILCSSSVQIIGMIIAMKRIIYENLRITDTSTIFKCCIPH